MASESTNGQPLIEKVKSIVEANLENDKFDISFLARAVGLSRITLYRKIKTATGKTINRFVREIRLNKAKELILNSDKTIAEIAYEVGFGSSTYFNRCFHKHFGSSPGEFRKSKHQHKLRSHVLKQNKKLKKAVLIIGLVLIACGVYYLIQANKPSPQPKDLSFLVTKPEFTGNPENEYLATGTNEVLINELSAIESITVLDQDIIEKYIEKVNNQKLISAKYILSFTIKEIDIGTIINWQITSNPEGKVITTGIDTFKNAGYYSTGKKIANDIVKEFDIPINSETKQRLKNIEPTNLTAEKFYLQAIRILSGTNIYSNQNLFNTAENLLHKAINSDSKYYKAYEELAFLHSNRDYWRNIHKQTFLDSSLYYANKAIQLNSQSYKGHLVRGSYFFHQNDIKSALMELDISTSINPSYFYAYTLKGRIYRYFDLKKCIENYQQAAILSGEILPQILQVLSFHFSSAGCFKEAKHYAQKAFELDQDTATWYTSLAGFELAKENYKQSIDYYLKAYEIKPDNSNMLLLLGKSYTDIKKYNIAAKYFDEYIEFLKSNKALEGLGVVHRAAFAYWHTGQKEKAEYYFDMQIKNTMKDLDLERPFHQYRVIDMAEVYAFRGDKKNAYKYIEFILKKQVCIPYWLNDIVQNDALFDSLRKDKKFKKLALEYNERYEAENKKVRQWVSASQLRLNQ